MKTYSNVPFVTLRSQTSLKKNLNHMDKEVKHSIEQTTIKQKQNQLLPDCLEYLSETE